MDDRLKKLTELAHMIKEAELAKLSKLETARLDIARESSQVRSVRRQSFPAAEPSAAHLSGAAEHWQVWCKNRLSLLSADEAQAAAEVESQRRVAARAFGRSSVLSGLTLKMLSETHRH